jgi:hypothetical protein
VESMFFLLARVQATNDFWSIIDRFDTLILAAISLIAVIVTATLTAKLTRRNDQQRDIWLKKAQLYDELFTVLNVIIETRTVVEETDLGLRYVERLGINREANTLRFYELCTKVYLWGDYSTYKVLQDYDECFFKEDSSKKDINDAIAKVVECMKKDLGIIRKK